MQRDRFEVGNRHLLLNGLAHLVETEAELGLEKFTNAADATIAKMVDVIGISDAIHDVAEIREASEHIRNRDARELAVEIGADDVDFVGALLIVSVDFEDVDGRMIVDLRVDFNRKGMSAFLEDFGIAESVDVVFGKLVALREEDFAIGRNQIFRKDTARKTVINAEFLEVFITSGAAEVITLLIEEFLDEERTETFFGDRFTGF